MNWINIHTDDLRGGEMMGADPVERGTWLFLLSWCATQENDGRIVGCKSWKDRRWQQTCGVTKQEVSIESDLYSFDGDDLVVHLYPVDKQHEVQRKREQAKKNGRMGGRPKKTAPPETIEEPSQEPTLVNLETNVGTNIGTNVAKRKEKGKDKEKGKVNGKAVNIPTLDEFCSYLIEKLPSINPEWTKTRATRAATSRYETYIADGWKDGRGNAIKQWKTKAVNAIKFEKPWTYGNEQPQQPQFNYAKTL
jgi:hypothetical protein